MTSGRDLFAPRMGVAMPLAALHFVFFLLYVQNPARTVSIFGFTAGAALDRPWTFLTYQFLTASPVSLFFGALAFFILGSGLEGAWGTGKFTVFWLVCSLSGSGAAWALGMPLFAGSFGVSTSLLFAYAFLFPDAQFFIYFVVPVKVKWLAWLSAAYLAWEVFGRLRGGVLAAAIYALGATGGFLFFLVRDHGAWRARKAVRVAAAAAKSAGALRKDDVLERRNRALFPRVEALRAATRAAAASGSPMGKEEAATASDLAKLVVPGVNVCKPVDFKGDKDGVCVTCDGFAECSLRYVAGQPDEIVVKARD